MFESKKIMLINIQNMKDLRTYVPFDSNLETMKNVSGKRHPGEKHNPGEESIAPN